MEVREELGCGVLVVRREDVVGVLALLRDAPEWGFRLLSDLSATDWLPREPRFDVNYHLYSFETGERLRVKVRMPGDDARVPSVTGVWPAADWMEREVYDLMGIVFTGHPDLRRILMPDEWVGHPLRKDYPTGGVPVEYKIEPAYIGVEEVSARGRASKGGLPPRLAEDRGKPSPWTWTGQPAAGVRKPDAPAPEGGEEPSG